MLERGKQIDKSYDNQKQQINRLKHGQAEKLKESLQYITAIL